MQARPEWRRRPARRALAYVGSLHFLLPGAMSVLSIAAPDVGLIWRASFTVAGVTGTAGLLLLARALREDADCPRVVRTIQWVGLPIYLVVLLFAVVPDLPARLGFTLTSLQVEAIVVSILLLFGVQSAWILLVETGAPADGRAEPGSS